MRATTPLLVTLALVLANALALWPGQSATAGADLSGTWDAEYHLACDVTFTQTGPDLSAQVNCGDELSGTLLGSVDSAAQTFTLSGMFGLLPIEVQGTLSDDGNRIEGSWSALPLAPSGTLIGRRNTPDGGQLTGDWTVTVAGVFGGMCTAEIEHSGNDLSAHVVCDGRELGTFAGPFDAATGAATLSGPFSEFVELTMEGTVSQDRRSFSGTWQLGTGGPQGIFEATRTDAPAGPDDDGRATDEPEAEPTATVVPGALPPTGNGGPAASGLSLWLMLVLAAGASGAGATFVAARRR